MHWARCYLFSFLLVTVDLHQILLSSWASLKHRACSLVPNLAGFGWFWLVLWGDQPAGLDGPDQRTPRVPGGAQDFPREPLGVDRRAPDVSLMPFADWRSASFGLWDDHSLMSSLIGVLPTQRRLNGLGGWDAARFTDGWRRVSRNLWPTRLLLVASLRPW